MGSPLVGLESNSSKLPHASLCRGALTLLLPARSLQTIERPPHLDEDNIDLKGLWTSLSSRAWHEFYPEKKITAPSAQELLDLGAVVVGKTKMTQFAETEDPTADWVDYHCPFNPRSDGYLTPEGSTSGDAASLVGYSWLDVSVGTDSKELYRLAGLNVTYCYPNHRLEEVYLSRHPSKGYLVFVRLMELRASRTFSP